MSLLDAALDLTLAAGLAGLALHIVMTRDGKGAIIGFIGFGLLLGLVWARLGSVDIALTEAAIGGGVTGMLLLAAHTHISAARGGRGKAGQAGADAGPPLGPWLLPALACLAVTFALGAVVLGFPAPPPSLAQDAAAALGQTGLGNPVTAVLLSFRAMDTLLEKIVLMLALVGVWSLATDGNWGGSTRLAPACVPPPLVFLARTLPPFGVLIAFYQFWVGADAPGGTFQAGTILAAMWLLALLAGLAAPPETRRQGLLLMLAGGPALFIAIGFLGFAMAGSFLAFPPALSKPLILAIEAALALSIAATLALLVMGPPDTPPTDTGPGR
jgi:multisubunit Na+/H+ antiporter MnhB subunit